MRRFHFISMCTVALIAALVGTAWHLTTQPNPQREEPDTSWYFGPPNARWSITEYADFECPYCRSYTPELKRWVSTQQDVNLKWHHFPLQDDNLAALRGARLAQCAGHLGGTEAFWQAIDQIISRGNSQGFPASISLPTVTTEALDHCADSDRTVAAEVFKQQNDARRRAVAATPTLDIRDALTGHTIRMEGPVDGATLLSIIDGLAAQPAQAKGDQ
jgi:protein-disulfide isomerase